MRHERLQTLAGFSDFILRERQLDDLLQRLLTTDGRNVGVKVSFISLNGRFRHAFLLKDFSLQSRCVGLQIQRGSIGDRGKLVEQVRHCLQSRINSASVIWLFVIN